VSDQASAHSGVQISEDMVREYLIEHGDFLQRNPDLMDHLHIEHPTGSAVSLVEKQVSVLRERNVDMRRRLTSLTSNARDNDLLFERTRSLVLRLLEAESLGQLCQSFRDSLLRDFGVEYAAVLLFGEPAEAGNSVRIESPERAAEQVGALLRGRAATCSALREEQLRFLFPQAGAVGSAAVVPLGEDASVGLVAVGSSDAAHYHSGMDTLFLEHIGEVILRLLPRLE
jgi:uncharacterized protein YigA (DUF484 family)